MVSKISSQAECNKILSTKNLVLVKFSAEWCGPCRQVAPVIDKLATQFPNVYFGGVDIDESQDLAQHYAVTALPSFIIFRDGQQVEKVVGGDIAKITSHLRTLSAAAHNQYGKGQRLGAEGTAVSAGAAEGSSSRSSVHSMAELREIRQRTLQKRTSSESSSTLKEKPAPAKAPPASRAPSSVGGGFSFAYLKSIIASLTHFFMLYLATIFSFDPRDAANRYLQSNTSSAPLSPGSSIRPH